MRNQVSFRASPITSLFMAKDASIQSDRRGERLSSTTNTAPRCTLWLSISIFSAHPSSKTGQAVLQGLHPSCPRIGRTRRTTLQPIRRSGVASGRRDLPEISGAVRRENLTESESRSESGEDMGREFVGKTVRSISLLVLALASMVASGQA